MKSFEHGVLYETPISHALLTAVHALGEYKGRQGLYTQQAPEVLETLRRVAMVQSVESSNRIEGITADDGRIGDLVARKSRPSDRSE